MGRFDALTQLDNQQKKISPSVEKPANPQEGKPANGQNHLPANPQVVKAANLPSSLLDHEMPEKYTTRLRPSMVKSIKVFAVQKDLKDYEVVETALNEYFKKNK
ncbi:MAG TPA: hypothetical protein VFV38_29645 [Ktedonobacteraceae bacterium]|nr:hypothetical protein [Ktedonobacteraceae bacterium]